MWKCHIFTKNNTICIVFLWKPTYIWKPFFKMCILVIYLILCLNHKKKKFFPKLWTILKNRIFFIWKVRIPIVLDLFSHCTWFFWIHFSDVKKIPNHFSFMLYMLVFNDIYVCNSNTLGSFDFVFVVFCFHRIQHFRFWFFIREVVKKA